MKDRPDRRRAPRRHTVEEHGIVRARVRPGHEAALVDVSTGGALVDTAHRLLPGTPIELRLASVDRCISVRGRVLRCAVTGLNATGVRYRGAIGFDRELSWSQAYDEVGYCVPTVETCGSPSLRADATRAAR